MRILGPKYISILLSMHDSCPASVNLLVKKRKVTYICFYTLCEEVGHAYLELAFPAVRFTPDPLYILSPALNPFPTECRYQPPYDNEPRKILGNN